MSLRKKTTDIDERVKYDAEDPGAGYIVDKFVAGAGITLAEGIGADTDKLEISTTWMVDPVEEHWDITEGLPVDPEDGDRYISDGTDEELGWYDGFIYEYEEGYGWYETLPVEGMMVWLIFEMVWWVFFSGGWMEVGGSSYLRLDCSNSPLTGQLDLATGTTTIAPIKFTSGDLLTTHVAGAVEYSNDRFYVTNVGTRRAIDRTSDVIVATTEVVETTTETTVYTGMMGAGALKVGNIVKLHCNGVLSNATASDDITLNVYIGSTLILSLSPALGNVTDAHWHIDGNMTVRTVGGSGTMAYHLDMDLNGNTAEEIGLGSVDTTIANNFYVKVQWNNAKAGNSFKIYQGYTEYKN